MHLRCLPILILCPLLAVTPLFAQKGKPPKPTSQPAIAEFRCAYDPGAPQSCPEFAPLSDGVQGDSAGLYSAVLNGNGEFNLTLQPGSGRYVWLDFRNGPEREPGDRRFFDTLLLDDGMIQTNVVDDSGNEVANGLLSLGVGESSRSRLKITFSTFDPATGETWGWAVRFNPEYYPGSDHVTVTRTSQSTWDIEALPTDRAVLASGVRRTLIHEGPFFMPFKITVTQAQ